MLTLGYNDFEKIWYISEGGARFDTCTFSWCPEAWAGFGFYNLPRYIYLGDLPLKKQVPNGKFACPTNSQGDSLDSLVCCVMFLGYEGVDEYLRLF